MRLTRPSEDSVPRWRRETIPFTSTSFHILVRCRMNALSTYLRPLGQRVAKSHMDGRSGYGLEYFLTRLDNIRKPIADDDDVRAFISCAAQVSVIIEKNRIAPDQVDATRDIPKLKQLQGPFLNPSRHVL